MTRYFLVGENTLKALRAALEGSRDSDDGIEIIEEILDRSGISEPDIEKFRELLRALRR